MLGLALTAGLVSPAQAEPAPDYLGDATRPPGAFTSVNLASDRTTEDFFYRIPALAHLGDGVVVASWDARPGSAADAPNPNSIIQRRSTDNGRTWGPLQIIAAGKLADADGPKYGYSDPSYVVDRETGRLFNFFVYSKDQGFHGSDWGNDDANRQVISSAVIHSDDGGVTWSEPRLITDVTKPANGSVVNGAYVPVAGDIKANFATSGEGIQLRYGEHAGRLVQQYAGTVRQADGSTTIQAYSVYSDDHGDTWHKGANVGTGMDENKVVELSDGSVMMNSRDSANGRLRKVAISTDGGETWGPVTRDAELPDPTNNASIIRLHPDAAEGSADARKLVFTNSNNGVNGNRVNGAARVSCDDGETWPGLRTIEPGFFAYSSATVLDDGLVGVLWERSYTSDIRFTTFDEAWLNVVCAPLEAPETSVAAGETASVPVTITNQEDAPLSGEVTFLTPSGWSATSAAVSALASGATTTVEVEVTAPAGGTGTQRLQAAFTATDGRLSQSTAVFRMPQEIGLTLTSTNTTAARDVVAQPYRAGDVLSFSLRVTSTADVPTLVTPLEANFTSGFLPTACRWQNLPASGAYTCSTPRRALTEADIDRGWFTPEFAFTVAPMSDTAATRTVTHRGTPVVLRDGVLGAEITGERTDTARDLATDPYTVGEAVPYRFRVDSTSPMTAAVVPVAGAFAPFLPPGPGNCRYLSLPAFGGYDCGTPRHTVTEEDLARGYFDATTEWTVSAGTQTPATITVEAPEVDLLVRNPRVAGSVVGTWTDVDANGVANVGDTVTWTSSLQNTGNVALEEVTANGGDESALAVGETLEVDSETVVLTADDLTAGELAPPTLEAAATNGSLAAAVEVTADPLVLELAPAWDATTIHSAGAVVTHEGHLWRAAWWTRNQAPGSPWGPWQQVVTDGGTDAWTASRIFTEGDEVVHDGERWVAEHWTRNQEPGEAVHAWTPKD